MSGGPAVVVVVGAGISGLACAGALHGAGVGVEVLDRGRRPGGRLGERSVARADGGERPVDTGAAYFTVDGDPRDLGTPQASPEPGTFAAAVHGWALRGLVRPWTDTLHLAGPDGLGGTKTGPLRWAAPQGLRSLCADAAERLAGDGVTLTPSARATALTLAGGRPTLDGRGADAVVLAVPDPQAVRVVEAGLGRGGEGDDGGVLADLAAALILPWDPTITVWARWDHRWWPEVDAAFVTDEVVSLVADDGRRRGDGEAVLVAHTTPGFAGEHLDDPSAALGPVLAALPGLLGVGDPVPEPTEAGAMRWTFSAPRGHHDEPFWLRGTGGGLVGVCGDSWGGSSKVERAWTSGHALGVELARRLTEGGNV